MAGKSPVAASEEQKAALRTLAGSRDPRSAQALTPQPIDGADDLGRRSARRPAGRRAPVVEGGLAARPMPRQPLVGRANRHAACRGRLRHPPALQANALNKKESTVARHPGMLVDVHPGLLGQTVWLRNHSLTPKLRMNNLHSNDN